MSRGRGAVLSALISDPSVLEPRARVLSESSHGSPFTARHSKLPPVPWGVSLWTNSKFSSSGRKISFCHKPVLNCSITLSDAWKRTRALIHFARCSYACLTSKSHSQREFPGPEKNGEEAARVEANQKRGAKLLRAAEESDPTGKSTKMKNINLW